MSSKTFDKLLADAQKEAGQNTLPPVEKWDPPLSGDIDIVINSRGEWWHEGDPIRRESLVKLFASILKKEGDDYFLVTPVEKWRIQVEDAPLLVTDMEVLREDGQQALLFKTHTGDAVLAGREHPLRVVTEHGEPSPYLMVRGGMEGRLHRNVFYRLAEIAEQHEGRHGVYSLGEFFPLE